MLRNKRLIEHFLKSFCIILGIAIALECFVFNFNYFASLGYNTIDLENRINLPKDPDDNFRLTSYDHSLEFSGLNSEVHNIYFDFLEGQNAQNIELSIHFTDEAHKAYFDSTEYSEGIPNVIVATNVKQSQYINLNATGVIDSLKIDVVGDDVTYPIVLKTVEINAHHPFDFSILRFSLVLFILLLVFIFRPKSKIYSFKIVDNPKVSKAGIIACVVVECMIVSAFMFYGSNLVGVATSGYNYGDWDGRSIANSFEVGGDNAQQYAELAKSISEGRLYLEEEPPQWLQELDDPYDKSLRDEAQKESGEDYLFDVAYYDGHYYVYFGVVPVLLFYLPFYLITGSSFPTAIGVLIAILAFILGCSALLDRFARYHFKNVSLGVYLLVQIPLVFSCGILYLLKFPTFYSLPIACALAFSVWGLYFWMRGRSSRHRCICFCLGSLCMALVAGCRPQLLMLSLLAFPLFWRPYIKEGRIKSKKGVKEFLCLILPYILVAICLVLYNYARFGSFFDFGANYNLTMNDMTKRGWNLSRFAPAFFAYFIQPPNVVGVFPFLEPVNWATTYMGQTIKESTFGGIFACLPVLWVIFFAPYLVKIRNAQRSTNTISGVIIVLVLSGLLIAMVDAQMAGILQRYYADFSFMFLAACVLCVFIANENIEQGSMTRNLLLKTLLCLVTISVTYSFLLCFVAETGWYSDIYPWAYQDLLETFLFWT